MNGFFCILSALCFVAQVIIGGQSFNEWLAAFNLASAILNGGIYLVSTLEC